MKNRVGALGLLVLILQMHLSGMLQHDMRYARSMEKAMFHRDRPEPSSAGA